MKCERWICVFLVASLAAVGCGGDDDGDNDPIEPISSTMAATIDGESWSAVSINVIRQAGVLAIGGASASAEALSLAFPDMGTGDLSIGPGEPSGATVLSAAGSWAADASHGSGLISVTTLTATRVVGTFSFTAEATTGESTPETRVVTNGSFDLWITYESPGPGVVVP